MTKSVLPLTPESIRGILPKGGTLLRTTNRGNPFEYAVDGNIADCSDQVLQNVKELGIDGLIAIGGDGTLKIAQRLYEKGVPMGLQMVVISSAALVMMGLVNDFGVHVAAAYGVAAQLWTYVQMPALAIGAAVSSMAAQNVGAGRWDRVEQVARTGVPFNLVLTGALVALLYAVDRLALGLFLPGDSDAVAIAVHINDVAGWSFVLFGVTIVLFGVVRASGAVNPPLAILVVSMLLLRVPFAWALRDTLGADAVWWSFPLGAAASLVLAMLYYRYGRWRSRRPAPEEPATGEAADTGVATPAMDREPLYEAP